MRHKSFDDMQCPIARSLERVGEWWSMLILRDALLGLTRFDQFQESLGIAPNMLTRRLSKLVEAGLLERRRYNDRPPRYEYVLTQAGRDFRPVLWALVAWGNRHFAPEGPSVVNVDSKTGKKADPVLVDRTSGRPATFYDGPVTTHVSFADPYCPVLRDVAVACGREQGLSLHPRGTVVVIEGPRFSTRAESRFYSQQGWEIINMTQLPEALLARELEMCYANVSLVTDYDVGVEGEIAAVSHEEVVRVFQENLGRLRDLLFAMIERLPEERECPCATALANARFEA